MGYLQSMFGGATELNFFPSSAYGETFKVLIFFAVFVTFILLQWHLAGLKLFYA